MDVTAPELDSGRLVTAAHELGHAIVWHLGGWELTEIRVHGHGERTRGHVTFRPRRIDDVNTARVYLAGLAAGREAAVRWCEENGVPHRDNSCRTDMANIRQQHRTPLGRQVTRAEARALARHLVRTHWPRIVRLAPRLALAGRISL